MPETRTVKGFSEDGLPFAEGDFECCTFDHSDNSPYLFQSIFSSKNLLKNSLGRKQERKQKIFDFEIFRVEMHQRKSGGRKSQVLPKFRVSPVMTTSIPLRIKFCCGGVPKNRISDAASSAVRSTLNASQAQPTLRKNTGNT